jgi:hypothetical protein
MKRFALIVVLAACGPKAKGPAAPTGSQNAPEYASLFAKDAAWTFTVVSDDDEPSETSETGFEHVHDESDATCRVSAVGQFDGGVVSWIECDDRLQGIEIDDPLNGLWIADAVGVYHQHNGELPAAGVKPAYGKEDLMFKVPPTEWDEEETDTDFDEPVSKMSVSKTGEAWCHSWTATMGASAWTTLCLGVDGPINGSFGWADRSSHEATFQRQP